MPGIFGARTPLAAFAIVASLAAVSLAATSMAATAAPQASQDLLPQAETAPFKISVKNGTSKVGEKATIVVTITAGAGFKCNDGYPHKVKNLAVSGATLDGTSVRGAIQGKSIVIPIGVTPTEAGQHKVTGQIRFSVCDDSQCLIKKAPLNATITGT